MDSAESDRLIVTADRWLSELQHKFSMRPFVVTVVDLNGKSVCVTKFIRSLQPPDSIIDNNASITVNSVSSYICN